MNRRPRPCLGARGARCPSLTRDPSGRCDTCRRAHQRHRDLERGSTDERGDGSDHRQLRKRWAPRVATGTVRCARPDCGQLINPGEAWDLGHDEHRNWRGPEHQACNRATRGALREPHEPRTRPANSRSLIDECPF
jgi:hypothetical protein